MGSALQFAAFLCICCLIRSVATHSNRDENKRLNKQLSNSKGPEMEDFYFAEEKSNDDNVKNGRTISQTAWSKEDNDQTLPVENKAGTQSSGEFSINNFVSYLLGVVKELKKEIFGLKERTSLKNTEESTNKFEDKGKETEQGKKQDVPKSIDSDNTDFRNKNDQLKSTYITYYYQKNGIKSIDDDLEDSSDVSDDSSHKPDEGSNIKVARKSEENTHDFKCMRIKTKSNKYSFNSEKTTIPPTIQTQTLHEFLKEFRESKEKGEQDIFTKPPIKFKRMEQNRSKPFGKGTKQGTALPQRSKTVNGTENNDTDSVINLNQENSSTNKTVKLEEYVTTTTPQNRKEDQEEPNEDETVVPGKNSKIRESSDVDTNSSVPVQTTMLPSIGATEIETYASTMFSENPTYQKPQEQITSPKPEDQIQAQKNVKYIKNLNEMNEHTKVSTESHKTVLEIPNHKESTGADIFDSEIKESADRRSTVVSTPTTIAYIEHDLNFEIDRLKTSDSFYIGITIAPTTTDNIMNMDNTNKETSDNFNDKKRTDENEKSGNSWQDENSSETGKIRDTEQTKLQDIKDYSNPEKSLKNKNLNNTNPGNNSEEEDDNLTTSQATDDIQYQNSKHENKNRDIKLSSQLQEVMENNKSLNKSVEIENISPDQEYDSEEKENEDFDIYDELDDTQDFNHNQESDLSTYDADHEEGDEMNPSNTETILANDSQKYVLEEKSEGPYDTFLDYFYKHSNNSYFHSLKNHSSNFYDEM